MRASPALLHAGQRVGGTRARGASVESAPRALLDLTVASRWNAAMERNIEPMDPSEWNDVRRIYLEGIETMNATLEMSAPRWEEWDFAHLRHPRLVCRAFGIVLGWAALSSISKRFVYRGVAEVSVYVAGDQRGKGIGNMLLSSLVTESEDAGIWTLQASIFPENTASVALHRKHGFREVGMREKLGQQHDGRWRDVMLLERRSRVTGRSAFEFEN